MTPQPWFKKWLWVSQGKENGEDTHCEITYCVQEITVVGSMDSRSVFLDCGTLHGNQYADLTEAGHRVCSISQGMWDSVVLSSLINTEPKIAEKWGICGKNHSNW